VVSRLVERAERIRVGAPGDPATEIGPLPHAEAYDKLTACVRLGIREGARLAAGGRRPGTLPEGSYLAATVLTDVTPAMQVFTEAVSGPLMRVTPFDTDEEAASLANTLADPAAAYAWSRDLDRVHRLAPGIKSPVIWVNSHNPRDRLTAAGHLDIDFYRQRRTVLTATGDDTPVPRFGARAARPDARHYGWRPTPP